MKQRWTEQMDDVLRANRGRQSASQIAAALGLSRNAVLGRAMRLGLERLPSTKPLGQQTADATAEAHEREPAPAEAHHEAHNTEAQPKPRDAAPLPEIAGMKLVPLLDLQRKHCRWPAEGEGRHTLFCGLDAEPGKPYCAGHGAIAYRKPSTGNPNLVFIARRFGKSNLETLMNLEDDAPDAPAASAAVAPDAPSAPLAPFLWRAPAA